MNKDIIDKEKDANDKTKIKASVSDDSNSATEEKIEAIPSPAISASTIKSVDSSIRHNIVPTTKISNLPCSESIDSTNLSSDSLSTTIPTPLISSTITTMALSTIAHASLADLNPKTEVKQDNNSMEKLDSTKSIGHNQTSISPAIKNTKVNASKEQEILPAVANIKKESNASVGPSILAPSTEISTDYSTRGTSVFIKKEPGEESTDNSNSNSNNSGPSVNVDQREIKLINDIKTESKCGLDLTDTESKMHEDNTRSVFDSHLKFSPSSKISDLHLKFTPEVDKHGEPIHKFGHEPQSAVKYPPTSDLNPKFEIKPFMIDPSNKFINENMDHKTNADIIHNECAPLLNKGYLEPNDVKYSIDGQQLKYPPHIADHIKYEAPENMAMKRPPYSEPYQNIRSPLGNFKEYNLKINKFTLTSFYISDLPTTSSMLKYSDALHKYPVAPMLTSTLSQDIKYTPPTEVKYRPPENLSKSQFSADNLMKGNMYGDYTPSNKYAAESPIDASARSTPNQDSQSSNSNLPSQHQHNTTGNTFNASLPSPHANPPQAGLIPHLTPNTSVPMLIGPSGLPHSGKIFNVNKNIPHFRLQNE